MSARQGRDDAGIEPAGQEQPHRHVGDLVLARVFTGRATGAPADFGTEVTPRNLAAELKRVGIALADARERTHTSAVTNEVAALQ